MATTMFIDDRELITTGDVQLDGLLQQVSDITSVRHHVSINNRYDRTILGIWPVTKPHYTLVKHVGGVGPWAVVLQSHNKQVILSYLLGMVELNTWMETRGTWVPWELMDFKPRDR